MTAWTFPDPPNVAVLTTRRIVEGGAPVRRVSHDAEDGAWQFHEAADPREEDAMVVSLRSMIARDATLNGLADLPEGWRARRDAPGAPWHREPAAPGDGAGN